LPRLRHRIGRGSLARNGFVAIAGWASLRDRLGRPETILCLGNGPSSEHPEVAHQAPDCLFRVNWVWLQRGILTTPQVVFTADPDLPPADSAAILGFPIRDDANRILRGHLRSGDPARPAYFVVSELGSNPASRSWPAFPTNGALMIAAAVELRPARLIVSGIDLYRHEAGKYPGAGGEANAYDGIHDRRVDIAFIRAALAGYRGEVVILSEGLEQALAAQ
jgi:hypothetical protein